MDLNKMIQEGHEVEQLKEPSSTRGVDEKFLSEQWSLASTVRSLLFTFLGGPIFGSWVMALQRRATGTRPAPRPPILNI